MKSLNTRTRYKLVGSDFSSQEPRLTAYMSQDENMIKAYQEGKDLYAVIASGMFGNRYEDNLEFRVPGDTVEIDGKIAISGTGKEYTITIKDKRLSVKYYDTVQTENGYVQASELKAGDKIITSGMTAEVINNTRSNDYSIIDLDGGTDYTVNIKSPERILNPEGKKRRSQGKTLLLALLYGMGSATAGQRMGKTAEEGKALMDNFFKEFPKVKKLIDDSKANLQKYGYVEDWAGRRRHLPDIFLPPYEVKLLKEPDCDENFNPFLECEDRKTVNPLIKKWEKIVQDKIDETNRFKRAKDPKWENKQEMSNKTYEKLAKDAYKEGVVIQANTGRIAQADRQTLNARIQGGAASLTKVAMVNIFNDSELKELDAHLIVPVHDEVLVECPAYYAERVKERLPKVMIDSAKPYISIPMACDPYAVTNWYADEAAGALKEEFKKAETKGLSSEEAMQAVYDNHPEFEKESIYNTIINDADLAI